MIGAVLFITLLVEVFVLAYVERAAWETLYTPLCCLMMPYLLVLLITITIAGTGHFVEFDYESIFVWNVGLLLFALPSLALSQFVLKYPDSFHASIEESKYPTSLGILSILLALAFFVRFMQVLGSSTAMFGTDDFAEDFSGHGIWAHLREVIMPLLIIAIYYVKRRTWMIWLIMILLLTVQFLYMVKGAVIISVVSGMCMRLYAGKTHLTLSIMAKALIGGFGVFILTYMVIPLIGNESGEANMELFEFVGEHFLHYFTSGTLGYSFDYELGCPDQDSFGILVSPFVNIYKTIVGDKELLSPVNPLYLNTGINITNVRTFFGTMHIYCNVWQFVGYTLTASSILYSIRLWATHTGNLFVFVILSYFCGLMAMGWFEFYLFHLSIIEIPIITFGLMGLVKFEELLRRSRA